MLIVYSMEVFKSRLRARSWSFKDKAKFHKHKDKRNQSDCEPKSERDQERVVTWQEEYYRRRALRFVHVYVNPYLTNGFSHCYHFGESTFSFRGIRSDFEVLFHFSMKFL